MNRRAAEMAIAALVLVDHSVICSLGFQSFCLCIHEYEQCGNGTDQGGIELSEFFLDYSLGVY